MLCLPLKAGSRVLGVFWVYSDRTYHFWEADTSFFSLMTDLTGIAIERLRSELSKTWFFNKAAYQLRAPLHALMSMLKVLKDGYLGPLTERQMEVINRCENRLRLMGHLIDDLMRLGEWRARDLAPTSLTSTEGALQGSGRSLAQNSAISLASTLSVFALARRDPPNAFT